jgi:hypothetical protein
MTEDEFLDALRSRITDPKKRIDVMTMPAPPLLGVP